MAISATPSARALSALSHLASLGSLTEAAEQLGVTRSALSHRIAELEKGLGVALVRKAGRKLVLTEDGERLLASVGDALERIEAAVKPFQRDRGEIRLSTVTTFASHWLIPRLADFQARHPRIEVTISTTTRAVDLGREDVDAAIRHGRGTWKGLTSTLLFKETLMPIAAPSVAVRLRPRQGAPLIRARSRFMDWSLAEVSFCLSGKGEVADGGDAGPGARCGHRRGRHCADGHGLCRSACRGGPAGAIGRTAAAIVNRLLLRASAARGKYSPADAVSRLGGRGGKAISGRGEVTCSPLWLLSRKWIRRHFSEFLIANLSADFTENSRLSRIDGIKRRAPRAHPTSEGLAWQ